MLELTPFVPEARDREPRGGRMRGECRWQLPVASRDCVSTGSAQGDERNKSHSTNANPTGGVAVQLRAGCVGMTLQYVRRATTFT